jgi:diguanylate cyclase (GGDEF)-like protein/PAS domain S-box-containing protein
LLDHRIDMGTYSGDPEQYCAALADALARGKTTDRAVELADGRVIVVVNQPMVGGGWVATHEDITERRRAERELERTRTLLDTVIDNMPAMLSVKEAREFRYVLVNRVTEELLGVKRDEMIGKNAYDFFPKEQADSFTAADRKVARSRELLVVGEHAVSTPHHGTRILTTKKLSIFSASGEPQYLLALSEDITERKRAEERVAHMKHHDVLTDLPNRAAFGERLAFTLERAGGAKETFAVLSLDLDRFKEINDVYGHAVGDALLREVAQRLTAAAHGAFVSRVGGDEFALISTDGAQPATAAALADRVSAVLGADFAIAGERLNINASIGVAIFPADGANATTLLAEAEAALTRAKADGRGSIRFFEADMDVKLREQRVLHQDLRAAIARGELRLHFQPQASITGEIVGFEALARWYHPTRGMVPPDVFIPLAEESGLIVQIGEWILRAACREAASWLRPLQLAVNLSPVQFEHGDLVGLVHTVLLETGLSPARLELEITEGVLICDFSRAVSILRRLKALGLRIAMDDFGTGYSSLSYLQSFPFDKIKIDKTFISNVERNPQSAAIVRAVIGLARGLDLPVVAEGVETNDQLAFLSRESCDEVQGYFVGPPRPITEYAELTGGRRPRPALVASH